MEQDGDLIVTIEGIEIRITTGRKGLWYATTMDSRYRGLLVTGQSCDEVKQKVPQYMKDLDAAKREAFRL